MIRTSSSSEALSLISCTSGLTKRHSLGEFSSFPERKPVTLLRLTTPPVILEARGGCVAEGTYEVVAVEFEGGSVHNVFSLLYTQESLLPLRLLRRAS